MVLSEHTLTLRHQEPRLAYGVQPRGEAKGCSCFLRKRYTDSVESAVNRTKGALVCNRAHVSEGVGCCGQGHQRLLAPGCRKPALELHAGWRGDKGALWRTASRWGPRVPECLRDASQNPRDRALQECRVMRRVSSYRAHLSAWDVHRAA